MQPHSAVLTLVGAAMLWVGWFGFNAGSALEASPLAVMAFCNTHFAAAAAAVSWSIAEWWHRGKISAIGAATGAVAGLVVITPACGFVTIDKAVVLGLIGGAGCFIACSVLKERFGYDDTLDAFGVHGVGGIIGALLVGVFAVTSVNESGANGLLAGNPRQLLNQVLATGVTILYSGSVTTLLLVAVNATVGIRVHEEEELKGLDLTQHGEVAYNV